MKNKTFFLTWLILALPPILVTFMRIIEVKITITYLVGLFFGMFVMKEAFERELEENNIKIVYMKEMEGKNE